MKCLGGKSAGENRFVMADSLANKEILPYHCQMMVAERERVDRLIAKNQHAQARPSPVPP